MTITSGDDAVMDFRAAENDKLDLGGQDYIVQDLPNLGVVLTLVDPVTHTTTGHVMGSLGRHRQIPWYQRISREIPRFFSVCRFFELDFACILSGLRQNSLELRAGNF